MPPGKNERRDTNGSVTTIAARADVEEGLCCRERERKAGVDDGVKVTDAADDTEGKTPVFKICITLALMWQVGL